MALGGLGMRGGGTTHTDYKPPSRTDLVTSSLKGRLVRQLSKMRSVSGLRNKDETTKYKHKFLCPESCRATLYMLIFEEAPGD